MNAILKIDNFSNYEIYPKDGKIWSLKNNKYVGSKLKDGYWQSNLCGDNGNIWSGHLHRVIYTACYGDIPKGFDVNHIDENKSNNSIFNLELLTRKENINYGNRNKRVAKALSKPVGAFKNEELIMIFPSTNEAQRQGYKSGRISECCRGIRKSHKGYTWKYI
jgi:hypothetical protein